jgi:hypothetical protein
LGRRSEAAAHYQRLSDEFAKHSRKLSDATEAVYQDIMA